MGIKPPPAPSKEGRPAAGRFRTTPPPSLARAYPQLPSYTEWQLDTRAGRSARYANMRSNDPVLRALDELIQALPEADGGEYLYLLGQLFFTSMSWLNHHKRDPRMLAECRKPVMSLNLFAGNELARVLECPVNELAGRLREIYGVNMSKHGVDTDLKENTAKDYFDAAKRERYRVFIIMGRACHFRQNQQKFKVLNTTSTDSFRDFSGLREGLGFVLSLSNKLFVGKLEIQGLHYHSYFMAGREVQCAGTMQFDKGVVTYVRNDSGHYKPCDPSLVKLLHYLRSFGMDLRKVEVGCEQKFDKTANKTDLKVPAVEFLRANGNWNAILSRATHQPAL